MQTMKTLMAESMTDVKLWVPLLFFRYLFSFVVCLFLLIFVLFFLFSFLSSFLFPHSFCDSCVVSFLFSIFLHSRCNRFVSFLLCPFLFVLVYFARLRNIRLLFLVNFRRPNVWRRNPEFRELERGVGGSGGVGNFGIRLGRPGLMIWGR